MNILPAIVIILMGSLLIFPLIANINGFGVSSTPVAVTKVQNCPLEQRNQSGVCPYTGRSNFRYISIGSGGGSRGGGGGGGK